MSELEAPRVALVASGEGVHLETAWFVEIGQLHGEPRFAEVGGDDEELTTREVLAHGHTVRWFRLQETDGPDGAEPS